MSELKPEFSSLYFNKNKVRDQRFFVYSVVCGLLVTDVPLFLTVFLARHFTGWLLNIFTKKNATAPIKSVNRRHWSRRLCERLVPAPAQLQCVGHDGVVAQEAGAVRGG